VEIAAGRIDPASPVLEHAAEPLPAVGAGQSASDALHALGSDHGGAVVLKDGRAVALISRSRLVDAALTTAR
jgi:cystathionine beta-synthase